MQTLKELWCLAIKFLCNLVCQCLAGDDFISRQEDRRGPVMLGSKPRSGRWPGVRREFLEANPRCAACGGTKEVVPHHIKSYHEHPELELDPENLIPLCERHNCHQVFGHLCKWTVNNPNVRKDTAEYRKKVEHRDDEPC